MQPFDVVVRGGTVVTAAGRYRLDLGIRGGRVAALSEDGGLAGGPEVIDARGKLVLPGLIDVHTHFGLTSGDIATSDDFYSGSVAAACGGVTTFIDFATPTPGRTVAEAVDGRLREASGSVIDYSFHGVLIEPPAVEEVGALTERGITSFKLYMAYKARRLMAGEATLAGALAAAGKGGGLAGVHAEDNDLVDEATAKLRRARRTAMPHFAASRPAGAESVAIARACRTAEAAGAPLYVFHLSTAAGLAEIRRARARGVQVWAETCPHYLTLTDEVYGQADGYKFVINPPLRKREDVEALWKGLAGHEVQVVSSDHCPFPLAAKARGAAAFLEAPAGIGGTELILTVLLSEGVAKGRLSLERVVQVTSSDPARLFGLYPRKGHVGPGADADFVIVDPEAEWTIAPGELHSLGDHTPYDGLRAHGRVVLTMSHGRVICRDGEFVGQAGAGRFLKRGPTRQVLAFPLEG
ncbi:MAG: dihydropyrimidinase [Bacillota bacterium]